MMQVGYRPQLRIPVGAPGSQPPSAPGGAQNTPPMSPFMVPPPSLPPPPQPPPSMSIPPPSVVATPNMMMPPPVAQQPQGSAALQQQQMMLGMAIGEMGFDGKMLRKTVARKTVDHNPSVVKYLEDRIWKKDLIDDRSLQADPLYTQQLTLPQHMIDNPVSCVMTKFIRAALNKDPRPVFCVCWTPDGRRLITGASSGEFTLWNGLTFNFETILQAHNTAIRTMIWSNNQSWMLSGDDKGYIKYWQANMNNVKMVQGHFEAIRGLSFSPTDSKFTSCSDDRTVRIFDFATCTEEYVLQGHGSDVKCVDWHPTKAVIISGSKDSQQPIILWDVKSSKKITTIHAHKNTCTDLKWNRFNGNWLVSSSRDHMCKLFDIRNLKEEVQSFRGHKKDACTVEWHPIYEKVFVSGGADGSLFFWHVGAEKEIGSMEEAHDGMIWDMSWHPLGHMLVSGSNDRSTRFWTRNRPGDTVVDKNEEMPTQRLQPSTGIIFKNFDLVPELDKSTTDVVLPGLGLDSELLEQLKQDYRSTFSPPPGAGGVSAADMLSPKGMSTSTSTSTMSSQQQQQSQPPPQQPSFNPQFFRREEFNPSTMAAAAAMAAAIDAASGGKKPVYSKPIPVEFEKAWQSNRPSGPPPPTSLPPLNKPPPPLGVPITVNINQPPPPPGVPPPGVMLMMNTPPPPIPASLQQQQISPQQPSPGQSRQQLPPGLTNTSIPPPSSSASSASSQQAFRFNNSVVNKPPPPIQSDQNDQQSSNNTNKRKLSQQEANEGGSSGGGGDMDERNPWQQPKSRQFNIQNQQQYSNYNNNNHNNDYYQEEENSQQDQDDYQQYKNRSANSFNNRRGGGNGAGSWGRGYSGAGSWDNSS